MSTATTTTRTAPRATGARTLRDEPRGGADRAIARRAFRQVWVGATVCGAAFGATAASSALSYVNTYATEASRHQLAATTSTDTALAVLLGPIASVDTVGGYTVYKGFVFLTTIGAIWALLAATRLFRGEEDSGRWQMVLAGSTRASRATAATLGALVGAVAIVFVGTTALTFLAGRNPDVGFALDDSVLYGLSIAMPAAVFVGVGAVTSQLGRARRTATSLGIGVLAVTFVVRMIADSGPGTHWLRWATPFGWAELMRPFTENDPAPLLVGALAVLVLGAVAIVLAGRRDAGSGVLAPRDVTSVRSFGLGSSMGMTARLELPVVAAWAGGAAVLGIVFGIIAKLTTASVPESLRDTLDDFGVRGGFAKQYFGVVFLLVAAVVALLPAGQVGAACDEETSGRVVHVFAQPTRRTRWFVGRLVLCGAGVVATGLLAGFGAWVGAATQGVGLDLAPLLGAGLNVVPTALVALGVGAVVLAFAPRAAAAAVYALVGWSLVVNLLASIVSSARWLEHASLFHYMALAPGQDVDPVTIAITTATGVALCVVATILFGRRDLPSG